MRAKKFVQQHRQQWKELESVQQKMRRKKTSPADIERFDYLYQKAVQHLSYSQTYYPDEDVTVYLNQLVSSAHNMLYKDQVSSLKQVRTFFGTRFVSLLLDQWRAVFVAMLLFVLGALGAFLVVINEPQHLYALLPDRVARSVNPEAAEGGSPQVNASLMSASIMTNNIKVGILAFAGGMTFGIMTVYVMVYNGIMVGALAGLFWHYGQSYEFWALIVPHGMVELTAIFIAGGAGLLMGYKLFVPGIYSRKYQFKRQTIRSVQLLLGTLPLFFTAGIIEGFITPAAIPAIMKYGIAGLTVLGLIAYILIGRALLQKQKNSHITGVLDS